MNYQIIVTNIFQKEFKNLYKKYHSLKEDLKKVKTLLFENPEIGDSLGGNFRKIRMAITSKNKGKSGGARIITYNVFVDENNKKIYLLTIYDKGDYDSISINELNKIKKDCEIEE